MPVECPVCELCGSPTRGQRFYGCLPPEYGELEWRWVGRCCRSYLKVEFPQPLHGHRAKPRRLYQQHQRPDHV